MPKTETVTVMRQINIKICRLHLIIIIMVIFKCYFSGEHIALSIIKNLLNAAS